MDATDIERPGLLETLKRLGTTLLTIFQNRLQLLVVELQEERVRLVNALLLLAFIVGLGAGSLVLGAVALVIVLWNALGLAGLFLASGCGILATLFTYWRLRVRLKNWPFLASTLAEFKKDCECLTAKK